MNKLLATDLDGTLLKNDKTVSKYTINKVHEMINEGHYFVVSTGRPYFRITKILKALDIISDKIYCICNNGGLIISTDGSNVLYEESMPYNHAVELIDLAIKYDVNMLVYQRDYIITDHHEPAEELPKHAIAIVDCKRKDNRYPFRELCGAGVAFKVCQAISQELDLDQKEYLKYLDIACIGTISDIVPLIDENRVITKLGLKLVQCTKNLGLKVLLKSIGYNKIDSTAIAFGVAPRINACGRMGHQEEALNLFLRKPGHPYLKERYADLAWECLS